MRRRASSVKVAAPEGVEVVLVDGATPLLTHRGGELTGANLRGAIVRVVPDAAMSRNDKIALHDSLVLAGVARVWFAPSEAAAAVVPVDAPAPEVSAKPREVVMALVEEAHTSDRARLRALADEFLTGAGL